MEDEVQETLAKKPTEKEKLIAEKKSLAEKIGIWATFQPIPGYLETDEYKRIEAIDKRLAEIG